MVNDPSAHQRSRKARFVVMMARALLAPLPLECHQGASSGSMAESLPSVAHRDLHRGEDDADRLSGILGISLARTQKSLAVPKMDGRDGALRKADKEWN